MKIKEVKIYTVEHNGQHYKIDINNDGNTKSISCADGIPQSDYDAIKNKFKKRGLI